MLKRRNFSNERLGDAGLFAKNGTRTVPTDVGPLALTVLVALITVVTYVAKFITTDNEVS